MITVRDIQMNRENPNSCRDERGRLRVAGATGTGEKGLERAAALFAAGADVIVVDTAHGHSHGVLETVSNIKKINEDIEVIAGNVATGDAASAFSCCAALSTIGALTVRGTIPLNKLKMA